MAGMANATNTKQVRVTLLLVNGNSYHPAVN